MKVIFHLGAPFTDDGLLVGSLQKNGALLASKGMCVPDPEGYRQILRELFRAYKDRPVGAEVEHELTLAITHGTQPDVLFLSNNQFVSANVRLFQGAQIWPSIQSACLRLRNLFPSAEVEFAVGIRNPAFLIPRSLRNLEDDKQHKIMAELQPHAIVWSEALNRLHLEMPTSRVIVWKHEATPYLWDSLLRLLLNIHPDMPLEGTWDMMDQSLPAPEIETMKQWIADNNVTTSSDTQRAMRALYLRHQLKNAKAPSIKPFDWTKEDVQRITDSYDADEDLIRQIPSVQFIDV